MSEAERLAQELEQYEDAYCYGEGIAMATCSAAASELRRLAAISESNAIDALNYESRIARLQDEVEALRADAERYRWLRSRIPGSDYRIMGVIYSEGGAGVDAAIDAARAK